MSEVRTMLIGEIRGEDAPGAQTVDTNARALAEGAGHVATTGPRAMQRRRQQHRNP